jgi:hypothetical protein
MSTLPAEIVRLGSICENTTRTGHESEIEMWRIGRFQTYDDGHERILELLIVHLGVDVYTRQPTPITRMRMIPPDRVL